MIHLSAKDADTLRHLGHVTIWQPASAHFSIGEMVETSAGTMQVVEVARVATHTTQFRRVTLEGGK